MRLHVGLHCQDDFLPPPHKAHDYCLAMVDPQPHHSLHQSSPANGAAEPASTCAHILPAVFWERPYGVAHIVPEFFWGRRQLPRGSPSPAPPGTARHRVLAIPPGCPEAQATLLPFSRILARTGEAHCLPTGRRENRGKPDYQSPSPPKLGVLPPERRDGSGRCSRPLGGIVR